MRTLRLAWRLIRYKPRLFILNCIAWCLVIALPIVTGLLTKGVFDRLSGSVRAGEDIWTLVAIMVANFTRPDFSATPSAFRRVATRRRRNTAA